ncbi:MAG: hypothetical protein ACTS73_05435 [Arsenophonus sp. NEOnobi-MAG3]
MIFSRAKAIEGQTTRLVIDKHQYIKWVKQERKYRHWFFVL